jgi:hypothetical protein
MVAAKRAIYASPERVRPTLSSGSVLSASISTGEATLNEPDRDVHYQLPAVGTHPTPQVPSHRIAAHMEHSLAARGCTTGRGLQRRVIALTSWK